MNSQGLKKRFTALKKDYEKITKKRSASWLYFLIGLFLLLPGQNYYQTLSPEFKEPLIREIDFHLPPLSDYPIDRAGLPSPELSSRAVIIVDVPSGVIVYQKNPQAQLLPASTTKMVTALVVLDNYRLDEVIEVGSMANIAGQVMGLFEGEKITVESLLYGLLVQSGNDAAETLARAFPGGRGNFVQKMNEKVNSLNLKDTHFVNPTGLDEENQYTTAFDLAQIAAEALKNPIFAKMVATKEMAVSDLEGDYWHYLTNVNQLLDKLWDIKGVKTGWTENAGECLVAYVERGERKIITVVLGSEDRFGETEGLISWVFDNFSWEKVTLQPIH